MKQTKMEIQKILMKTINNIPDILLELKPVLKNVRSKEINDPVAKRSISYYNSFLNVLAHAGGKL